MGGKSSSSSSTSSSTKVQELNLQDTGGFTIADNQGPTGLTFSPTTTTNTTTIGLDAGAVRSGADVAKTAIQGNTDVVSSALGAITNAFSSNSNIASDAISANTNTTTSAFQLAGGLSSDVSHAAVTLGQQALDTGGTLAIAGLDHAAAAYQSGLTFQNDALTTVANIAQDSLLHQESLTNNAISGFQSIAQQNSASDSTQIQKIALYAVAAAVLIVVLPAMFKS